MRAHKNSLAKYGWIKGALEKYPLNLTQSVLLCLLCSTSVHVVNTGLCLIFRLIPHLFAHVFA